MNWFFIALAAPFLWSLVNITDQYVVAKYADKERGLGGLIIFINLINIPVALLIGIFASDVFKIPVLDKLLLIVVGLITAIWVILYLFALSIESVSTVALWFLSIPVFGYILSYIFLKETLSVQQLIGSLIILAGLFFVSVDFSKEKQKFKFKFLAYILSSCFLFAVGGVIFKYVTVGNSFWVSSFWQYCGLGSSGILIYLFVPKYRGEFRAMIKNAGGKIFALTTGSELLNISGNLVSNYALLLAPVAIVYTINSFQPAIILLITIFCTFFLPNIVKEDLRKKVIIPKLIAVVVVVVGSIMLFV